VAKDGQQAFGKVEHVYDLAGQALGIYKSGAPLEEIVWLGDLPVGTIQGGAAYHIAPDHLGAPHRIVNSANAQVWLWDHDPFGNGAPAAAAGFSHRLRFPGQVYDAESGLHSNGRRDYDPRLGRYVESDPLGLEGGINTYAYAGNDPVNAIDPLGLARYELDGDGDGNYEFEARWGSRGKFLGDIAKGLATFLWDRLRSAWPTVERQAERAGADKSIPSIKPGAAGGETAGKDFSRAVRDAAKAENPSKVCVYCRREGTATQVDHAIPKAQGGNATLDNAQLACPHCNASKGARDFPVNPPPGYRGEWPPLHWGD
jgi:RHS repeat-associated protein